MASVWTAIPDSDIDPDSPFTTGLATAYRENVIAAFEGASGAPDLVEAALTAITAGSSYKYFWEPEEVSTNNSTVYAKTYGYFIIPRTGSYQIAFELKQSGTSGTAYAKIYRNASIGYSGDVAYGTEHSRLGTTYQAKSETLSFNAGDVVSLWTHDDATADSAEVQNFSIEAAVKQHG